MDGMGEKARTENSSIRVFFHSLPLSFIRLLFNSLQSYHLSIYLYCCKRTQSKHSHMNEWLKYFSQVYLINNKMASIIKRKQKYVLQFRTRTREYIYTSTHTETLSERQSSVHRFFCWPAWLERVQTAAFSLQLQLLPWHCPWTLFGFRCIYTHSTTNHIFNPAIFHRHRRSSRCCGWSMVMAMAVAVVVIG